MPASMNAAGLILVFAADAILVTVTAWGAVCAAGLSGRGLVESSLSWLVLALAMVAGSGVVLGMVGLLGPLGFLGFHVAGLAAMIWCRPSLRADFGAGRDFLGAWARLLGSGTPVGWIAVGLLLTGFCLGALAAQAEPITYDALTYRLSRIGAWLQEGWIRHFPTDDPRLNYMPVASDVVIAWLLGATRAGFRLAAWSQLAGGALLLGATYGLARTAELSRLGALGAVVLVLGMANVAVQFTSLQSDLFTAGVLAAAYLLWHRALVRGEGSWVAGLGMALAFGSKGTMFYLAPGLALWAGWLAWTQRANWRVFLPTAAGAVLAGLILIAPALWRNANSYGGWFGPPEAVVMHHGTFTSPSDALVKLLRNLGTSGVQALEPNAQPLWLQSTARSAGFALAARLPSDPDPHVFMGLARRGRVERVLSLAEPDADVVSGGIMAAMLFFAGLTGAALRWRRDPVARQVFVWGAGVVTYLLVQHALVQWHQWTFRFMVLAAPWVAVTGAWALCALPGKVRLAAWTLALVAGVEVFFSVQLRTSQAAWQATVVPERSGSYLYYRDLLAWVRGLDPATTPLNLALPINEPLAAFFRQETGRRITLERLSTMPPGTAEAAVAARPGWLVVPLDHFMGNEGRVLGSIGSLRLAAYRALRPGERPVPLLYGNRSVPAGEVFRHELVVRAWSDAPVQVAVTNPTSRAWRFELRTPLATVADEIAAGARRVLVAPVPPDVLTLIKVEFFRSPSDLPGGEAPTVQLGP